MVWACSNNFGANTLNVVVFSNTSDKFCVYSLHVYICTQKYRFVVYPDSPDYFTACIILSKKSVIEKNNSGSHV